jgi:hypothetical protein
VLWFAAVQSATGQMVLKTRGLPADDYESFVLVEDGKAYFKSDAFFRTLRYMKWPWPLLRVGRILPRVVAIGSMTELRAIVTLCSGARPPACCPGLILLPASWHEGAAHRRNRFHRAIFAYGADPGGT